MARSKQPRVYRVANSVQAQLNPDPNCVGRAQFVNGWTTSFRMHERDEGGAAGDGRRGRCGRRGQRGGMQPEPRGVRRPPVTRDASRAEGGPERGTECCGRGFFCSCPRHSKTKRYLRDHADCTPNVARQPDDPSSPNANKLGGTYEIAFTERDFNDCIKYPDNVRTWMNWQNCVALISSPVRLAYWSAASAEVFLVGSSSEEEP